MVHLVLNFTKRLRQRSTIDSNGHRGNDFLVDESLQYCRRHQEMYSLLQMSFFEAYRSFSSTGS